MKLSLKVLIHFIFWAVFLAATISVMYSPFSEAHNFNKPPHLIINTIWAGIVFYLFYFFFIDYFENGKFYKYLLTSVVVSVTITFLLNPLHKIFNPSYQVFNYLNFAPPIVGTFILAQCGSLVKGFENWFDNIKQKAELKNQNLKNELELLKSQVNPHFLFNTLNNIDMLIHKSPDDASKSLLSLSDMLRYMIYETNTELVPLNKELEYIRHYIALQKLRFRDSSFIKANLPIECHKIQIAPMLLLPFVENAFKYVVTNKQMPAIEIDINCNNSTMFFKCINQYNNNSTTKTHSGGVGLENVKRRLELIYSKKYQLSILKENNIFMVELKLDLK